MINNERQDLRDDNSHGMECGTGEPRLLSEQAKRALAEAKARRNAEHSDEPQRAREVSGRGGLEPVRYGDWEIKGIASDF